MGTVFISISQTRTWRHSEFREIPCYAPCRARVRDRLGSGRVTPETTAAPFTRTYPAYPAFPCPYRYRHVFSSLFYFCLKPHICALLVLPTTWSRFDLNYLYIISPLSRESQLHLSTFIFTNIKDTWRWPLLTSFPHV